MDILHASVSDAVSNALDVLESISVQLGLGPSEADAAGAGGDSGAVVGGQLTAAVWAMVREVDYLSPVMVALSAFHLLSALAVVASRSRPALIVPVTLVFGMSHDIVPLPHNHSRFTVTLLYFLEHLNTLAADNWELIAPEQYFDERGFFAAIFVAIPIIINWCLLLVHTQTHTQPSLAIQYSLLCSSFSFAW